MAAAAHLHGSATAGRTWTQQEQKTFELVLASSFHDPDRWTRVAAQLPGRSLEELLLQFAVLESDIQRICDPAGVLSQPLQQCKKARVEPAVPAGGVANRKGVPWTQEEHRLFLLGLSKFGKGSWRSIARQFVITRTPTQVASHAQKYFLRLNVMKDKKDKRRASIHDMHLH